jgi:alpha-mannosidase
MPKAYDAWNIDPGALDHMTPITALETIELVENGLLRATLRLTRRWGSSTFTQDISLTRDRPEATVETEVDWRERHVLLKAAFPLAASAPAATFEIPYGSIQRPTTRNNSWEAARFEVPALRWADLGDGHHGFSLINEAKYGYDAKDNVLRLSLLRAPTNPDPDADQGRQHFAYALYPHGGDWRDALTVRRGYEFNSPLTATQVAAHPGSQPSRFAYLTLGGGDTLVLTAAKMAEDGDGLVLRFYEWAGHSGVATLRPPPNATGAVSTDLMERAEDQGLAVRGQDIRLPYTPFSIVTVKVTYPQR